MSIKDTLKEDRANIHKTVHHVLVNSYMTYFMLLFFGIVLDVLYPVKLFEPKISIPVGFALMFLSTALIFWAQQSSWQIRKDEVVTIESFKRGPYKYSRNPTHWGLFILIFASALILDDFFIIIFNLIAFLTTKYLFIKKEEKMLCEKYDGAYVEYKKNVSF